jgi:hypothetical protein
METVEEDEQEEHPEMVRKEKTPCYSKVIDMEISAVWLGAKGSRRCRANVVSERGFGPNEPEELTSSSGSDSDPFAFVPSCERGKAIPASKKNGDSKIDKILAQERTYRKMDKAEINHVP